MGRYYKYRIVNNPDFIPSQSAPTGLHAAYVQHDSKDPQAVGGLKINQTIIIFISENSLASQLAVQLFVSHEFPF